jgi:excisionase family DNA binding protein
MDDQQLGFDEEVRRRRFERPGGAVTPGSRADDDPLLSAVEVADKLRMTPDWVYAETRAGRLPAVRLGRFYRYRLSTLNAWLAEVER